MCRFIPVPRRWREPNPKFLGPPLLLKSSYVFVLIVALACFAFGIFWYGTIEELQEFEITSEDRLGTDGWVCSSIASQTLAAPLLSDINGFVHVDGEVGLGQVLLEGLYYNGFVRNEDEIKDYESELTDLGAKSVFASEDWYSVHNQTFLLGYEGTTFWPLTNQLLYGYTEYKMEKAAQGGYMPEALSRMTIFNTQAPTLEECVDALEDAVCVFKNDDKVVKSDLKMYRFSLTSVNGTKVPSFADCNSSYYSENDYLDRTDTSLSDWYWNGCYPDEVRELYQKVFDIWYSENRGWTAPRLGISKFASSGFPYFMADQEDGWYLLAEHEDSADEGCDALMSNYHIFVVQIDANEEWTNTFPGPDTFEFDCQEVSNSWCVVDATSQMATARGDMAFESSISTEEEYQSRLMFALSDVNGDTSCGDLWQTECKANHNFQEICEFANVAPYKCERTRELSPLTVLSLSWSAMELVLAVSLTLFGIAFAQCCRPPNEEENSNGDEDAVLTGQTKTIQSDVAGDGGDVEMNTNIRV